MSHFLIFLGFGFCLVAAATRFLAALWGMTAATGAGGAGAIAVGTDATTGVTVVVREWVAAVVG